jgi:hypothetical protein
MWRTCTTLRTVQVSRIPPEMPVSPVCSMLWIEVASRLAKLGAKLDARRSVSAFAHSAKERAGILSRLPKSPRGWTTVCGVDRKLISVAPSCS